MDERDYRAMNRELKQPLQQRSVMPRCSSCRLMSKKVRIIKRTMPDGRVEFTIQERHFLFFWWWVDAWVNHDVSTKDSFPTLEEAQKNLCYFDGTKCREEVVQ